jgi:hypothetical protein
MATNDKKINIYQGRLFSLTGMKEQFLDLLWDELGAVAEAAFFGKTGTLHATDIIELNNSGGGSTFTVDLTGGATKVFADGHTIDLSLITGTGITEDIPCENSVGVDYYVGVKYAEVEYGVENNPRRGDPEYPSLKQTYGELDNPDSVADNATYIRLVINAITESGVDHSGRTVRVWLVDPVSPNEAVAFFEGTSAYSAPNNYVDIPYSGADGPLGQDTGVDPPSTTATDYKVFIEGVTWKRNTDLRNNPDYAFLGIITGGTPPTFDMSDQEPILRITLDTAYDSTIGGGAGRIIEVDSGAVEMNTPGSSGDTHRAQLRLNRLGGGSSNMDFMLEIIQPDSDTIPLAVVAAMSDLGSGFLQEEEPVTLAASTVTLTRGGVNLTWGDIRLNNKLHLIWLHDLDDATDEGLYAIQAFGVNTIGVYDLDGSFPAFTATIGKATILHPRLVISGPGVFPLSPMLDWWEGSILTLSDGEHTPAPLRILPETRNGKIIVYDASLQGVTYYDPREMLEVDPDAVGKDDEYPFKIRRSVVLNAGTIGAPPEEPDYRRDGLRIYNAAGSAIERDPRFALAVDYGEPEEVPTTPGASWPMSGIDVDGGFHRGHHFRDDFMYHPAKWNLTANAPPPYFATALGGSSVVAVDGSTHRKYGHGCCELEATGAPNDEVVLYAPQCMNLDVDYDFRWVFRARIRLDDGSDLLNSRVQIGLGGGANFYFFERSGANIWNMVTSGPTYTVLPVSQPVGLYQWLSIMVFDGSVIWSIATKGFPSVNTGSGLVATGALSGTLDILYPFCVIRTLDGSVQQLQLDYWEWWDRETIYARFGNSYNLQHLP